MIDSGRAHKEGPREAVVAALHGSGQPTGELVYGSRELFRGRDELVIEHDGSRYRLRITRQGKLILNK